LRYHGAVIKGLGRDPRGRQTIHPAGAGFQSAKGGTMTSQERTYSMLMLVALTAAVVVTFVALIHSWGDLQLFW
jgi:hypothetical protein